jgi:hypothetical protein
MSRDKASQESGLFDFVMFMVVVDVDFLVEKRQQGDNEIDQ